MPTKRARFGFTRAAWVAPLRLPAGARAELRRVCSHRRFLQAVRRIAETYRLDTAEKRTQPSSREVELALAAIAAGLHRIAHDEGGLSARIAVWARIESLPSLAVAMLLDAAYAAGCATLLGREVVELDPAACERLAAVYESAAGGAAHLKSRGAQRGAWPERHAAHLVRELFGRYRVPFYATGNEEARCPALVVLAVVIPGRSRGALNGYIRDAARAARGKDSTKTT